ncbi:MAG: oligopeptide transport system permease protein [Gammaproteobacteria bacterium]|jgi:oligopeptide transport system permease protein
MLKFIFFRILQAIPVLLLVITVTFALIHAAPGGPFDSEKKISPEILRNLNERYNLNAPVYEQYFDYLKNLIQGDLGPSFKYVNRSVTEMIATGLPVTLELGFYAMILALSIGISAGLIAAVRPNSAQDYASMTISMIGICLPSFLMAPLLVLIFSIWLGWFPVSGWGDSPLDKVLPSFTLGFAYAAYIARMTRGGMLEILSQEFIRTARSKGLSEVDIILKHSLRGGLLPVITFLGPAFAGLLSGSFIIETIFQIPGIGRLYIQAAFNRDYTMIMGTTIFFATLIVAFNLLSDILSAMLNPRITYEDKD